jgi:hypothetical protein
MNDRRDDKREQEEKVIDATVIPDRIPEANSPEPHDDHWDVDRTDPLGGTDEVGESRRDAVPDPPEGGEVPRANEDRIEDRGFNR